MTEAFVRTQNEALLATLKTFAPGVNWNEALAGNFARSLKAKGFAILSEGEARAEFIFDLEADRAAMVEIFKRVLEIADQGSRRIETAMDACDKITVLCFAALPASITSKKVQS